MGSLRPLTINKEGWRRQGLTSPLNDEIIWTEQDLESQSTSKDPGCWSRRGLTPRPSDRLTGTLQTELSGRMCGLSYTQSNIKGQDLKNYGHFIVLVDTLIQFLNGLIPKSDQHQFSPVKGPRGWQNLPFAVTRFHYMEVLCHIIYCYWGKENHLLDMYRGPSVDFNLIMTKAWSKRHCKFLPFIFTLNIIVLKSPCWKEIIRHCFNYL